jgi:hypothetical protein
MLFVRPGEDDGVVQSGRLLQRDVGAEWVAEAGDEELYLLWLSDGWVTSRERHELLAELVDEAGPVQHG